MARGSAHDDPTDAARLGAPVSEDAVAGEKSECQPQTPQATSARVASGSVGGLSVRDQQILDFEALWFRHAGAKANRILTEFDMSEARYFQVVNTLIDTEAALAYAPITVNRLRRLREQRQAQRTARRHGFNL